MEFGDFTVSLKQNKKVAGGNRLGLQESFIAGGRKISSSTRQADLLTGHFADDISLERTELAQKRETCFHRPDGDKEGIGVGGFCLTLTLN